jgi:two-component system sensor histidine kinase RegB
MKLTDLLIFEEDLQLEKKTVVILRWIALIGQLVTIYIVHFFLGFKLPLIFCSLTIFCGGLTNIFIQYNFKKNQLSNIESTILLFYDVIQLSVLIFLTGGVTNPFVIFLIVPSIVTSALLNLASTLFLSAITIILLILLTFNYYPLPHPGNLHFHVPEFYIRAIPTSLIIVLIFLNYFGFRFGFEARKRGNALNKLESVLAKEHELDSIGHQAAAAAHSLGTPLSTITVIAKELRKEISKNTKYSEDIDTLLIQVKRCGEILRKLSKREIVDDKYISNITLQDLLFEISKSFEQNSDKKIILNLKKINKKIPILRSAEMTYGIRNFVGNAVKYSKNKVQIDLIDNGQEVLIRVSDDGPGFPEDILKVIGEPYISSKSPEYRSKSGMGLGTFIGKTLLERKKAKIDFYNSKKAGAITEISWDISDIKI